jgi:primase-polymerase (primpol)-like protein
MSDPMTRFSTKLIPEALKAIPQWVVWFPVHRHGRLTKVPYDPTSAKRGSLDMAKTNDPKTWSDYTTACRVARQTDHGIGIVLTSDLGITGVDVDHCIEDKRIIPWVRDLVRQLDTYTEVSPSGTGLRMFAYGEIPKALKRSEQGLELYKTGRFLTITGGHVSSTSLKVEQRSEAISALYDAFAPVEAPARPPRSERRNHPTMNDEKLIDAISSSGQGVKFLGLYNGDANGFGSAIEADMSLVCILCWWTDDDAQVEAVMRTSALAREKYQRPDYLRRTIESARRRVR